MESESAKILTYAKTNIASFEKGGVSSNEIYFFEYGEKKYVLKRPIMIGNAISPFWIMMKNVFHYTFEKQSAQLEEIYSALKKNPHIFVAPFVAADESASIFERVEGASWDKDEFPGGKNNAFRLGQYVGYNHLTVRENYGIMGIEDATDFVSVALAYMEKCVTAHWNDDDLIDKKTRQFFAALKKRRFEFGKYSLIMTDMSADQFIYDGDNIAACVDFDGYVIGPPEWELSFLKNQIADWDAFQTGYETYRKMPKFEETSDFFFFLTALNSYKNKREMTEYWSKLFTSPF